MRCYSVVLLLTTALMLAHTQHDAKAQVKKLDAISRPLPRTDGASFVSKAELELRRQRRRSELSLEKRRRSEQSGRGGCNPSCVTAQTALLNGSEFIFAANSGYLFFDRDNGLERMRPSESMTPELVSTRNFDSMAEQGSRLYAEWVDGAWHSDDDGESWAQDVDIFSTSIAAGDSLIVGGTIDGKIYISKDGGESWSQISFPAGPGNPIFEIAVRRNVIVFAFAFEDTYVFSQNAGEDWFIVQSDPSFFWSDEDYLYTYFIAGTDVIRKSEDASSWEMGPTPGSLGLPFGFYRNPFATAVIQLSLVWYLIEGETVWRGITIPDGEIINDATFGSDGRLYAATNDAIRFSTDPLYDPDDDPPAMPTGELSTNNLMVEIVEADTATTSFSITNTGTVPLPFAIETQSSFLSLNPDTGRVAVGGSQRIDVRLNVAGLPSGTYEANINVEFGSERETINLTLTLSRSAGTVAPTEIVVTMAEDTLRTENVTISSTGVLPLTFSARTTEPWLTANPDSGEVAVGAQQDVIITISNSPLTESGTYEGVIEFVIGRDTVNVTVTLTQLSITATEDDPKLFETTLAVYPNPALHWLEIRPEIPTQTSGRLSIFDVLGREVLLIEAGNLPSMQTWRIKPKLPPGLYAIVLQMPRRRLVRPIVWLGR